MALDCGQKRQSLAHFRDQPEKLSWRRAAAHRSRRSRPHPSKLPPLGRKPVDQRKAVLRLNRANRELGADGSALVHEVLVLGMTMEQVRLRRGLRTQRWSDYFARRLRECLDRLALIYGFATELRG